MRITQVKVFPAEDPKLKAFVSIVIDDCFLVRDIKIIAGADGLFVSMPSKKGKDGSFRDVAHPLNQQTRRLMESRIIEEYRLTLKRAGASASTHLRELDDAPRERGASDSSRSAGELVDRDPAPSP